jgi:hypothetical protein
MLCASIDKTDNWLNEKNAVPRAMGLPSYMQVFGAKAGSTARVAAVVEESMPVTLGWQREGGSDSLTSCTLPYAKQPVNDMRVHQHPSAR